MSKFEVEGLFSAIEYESKRLRLTDEQAVPYLDECHISEKQWESLKPTLDAEQGLNVLEDIRERLQHAVRRKVITNWLNKNCANETEAVRGALFQEINTHARNGRLPDIDPYLYLCDVLEFGHKQARKKLSKRKWGGYWGHAWEVLVGLFRVGLTLAILHAASTKFETISFALLILIYYAIYRSYSGSNQLHNSRVLTSDLNFRRIRQLLKEKSDSDDVDAEHELRQETQTTASRESVRHLIRSVFYGVIWLIAIGGLIFTLLS
jgi:hypothetical protein